MEKNKKHHELSKFTNVFSKTLSLLANGYGTKSIVEIPRWYLNKRFLTEPSQTTINAHINMLSITLVDKSSNSENI